MHSVETYLGDRLVGGLYGVRIAGLFAGESMFSDATDASKVALVSLVDWLVEIRARACSTCNGRRRTLPRSVPSTCRASTYLQCSPMRSVS